MGYALPSPSSRVTSSWADHQDRTPPSTMPGTDYGVDWGSPCYAIADATVTEIHTGNDGGGGRYVQLSCLDGRDARTIHMQKVSVKVGQKVKRGQRIGDTGASGYGSDYYYGPHVHQTLWPGNAWAAPTIDFERYVGTTPEPQPEPDPEGEEDMAMHGASYVRKADGETVFLLFNEVSGWWLEHTGTDGGYNSALAQNWGTNSWPAITDSHAQSLKRTLDLVRNPPPQELYEAEFVGGPNA